MEQRWNASNNATGALLPILYPFQKHSIFLFFAPEAVTAGAVVV